jgi:6,7-dimethyl-8-ribityllumazine synthase
VNRPRKIAVVVGRFNRSVTDNLVEGAFEAANTHGCVLTDEDVYPVPGAFELPLIAQHLASSGRYEGIACLGAVVRGETPHFDYVCEHAAAGVQRVALDNGIPVAFGVVTTDTMQQALERAGGAVGNKGYEAYVTILEVLTQIDRIKQG